MNVEIEIKGSDLVILDVRIEVRDSLALGIFKVGIVVTGTVLVN